MIACAWDSNVQTHIIYCKHSARAYSNNCLGIPFMLTNLFELNRSRMFDKFVYSLNKMYANKKTKIKIKINESSFLVNKSSHKICFDEINENRLAAKTKTHTTHNICGNRYRFVSILRFITGFRRIKSIRSILPIKYDAIFSFARKYEDVERQKLNPYSDFMQSVLEKWSKAKWRVEMVCQSLGSFIWYCMRHWFKSSSQTVNFCNRTILWIKST